MNSSSLILNRLSITIYGFLCQIFFFSLIQDRLHCKVAGNSDAQPGKKGSESLMVKLWLLDGNPI